MTPEQFDERRAEEVRRRTEEYLALLQRWVRGRGPGADRNGRLPPVTPFLLVRHALSDIGARPVPPGVAYWTSPDIRVLSSDPAGNPVAGEQNTLIARVLNLGAFQAVPVQVQFHWADPSMGLVPESMHFIGEEWVDVPSLSSVEVPCPVPWVPAFVNEGHECVVVSVSSWIADPIRAPFSPATDRHVGQRNLHVIDPSAAARTTYSLTLTNAFPFAVTAEVVVRPHRLALTGRGEVSDLANAAVSFTDAARLTPAAMLEHHRPGTQGHRIAAGAVRRARRHPVRTGPAFTDRPDETLVRHVQVEDTGQEGRLERTVDERFAAALLEQGGSAPQDGARALGVPLEAGTSRTVAARVAAPDDLRDDEVVVVHLQQRVGGVVLGGYTVVVASRT
ncbi:hypothetical protein [Kineococcus terrestris]|uniref:hypothetical protein n=1 Tax=Kineococcus terrestris TaxID=2044856 RepID=UPI0034DB6874